MRPNIVEYVRENNARMERLESNNDARIGGLESTIEKLSILIRQTSSTSAPESNTPITDTAEPTQAAPRMTGLSNVNSNPGSSRVTITECDGMYEMLLG
jgi:hypothetical protein